MNDVRVVILAVSICAGILVFTVLFISYVYRRRRASHVIHEKPSPLKPSYLVAPRTRTISGMDLQGPEASPVTPTEFFGTGRGVTLDVGCA